jgi:putative NIF3 family GTP cyclohydrolase 1 type 2
MKAKLFILSLLSTALISGSLNGQGTSVGKNATAGQLISAIIENTGCKTIPNTVDVIKEGDPKTIVTGIITCMFATMDVLKEAVAKKSNLLIVHEPLYYNHLDATENLRNDPVFLEKKKFITDHNLVIWRFHDYIHSMRPDGIEMGMINKLGWKDFVVKGTSNQFVLPETSLKELLKNLKQVFPKNAFYVVGNPDMKLTNVRLAEGAPGSTTHIRLLEDNKTQVLLAGESQQWETYEYMRDAVSQGKNKAIIFLGHVSSEEAGMDFCSTWLKNFVKDIPVTYIECGPAFWSF